MDFGSDYVVLDENFDEQEATNFSNLVVENSNNSQETELNAIKYLCLLKEPSKILNSIIAFKALQYLTKHSLSNANSFESSSSLSDNDLENRMIIVIIDFLQRQLQNFDDLINKFENYDSVSSASSKKPFKSIYFLELRFDYLIHFLHLLHNYSKSSALFCNKYHENKGVKVLFLFLNNKLLLQKLNQFSTNIKSLAFKSLNNLVALLLCNIKNLSCYADKFKSYWDELNSIDVLLNISKSILKLPNLPILAYISLANVFNDTYVDKLDSIRVIIENLVFLVQFFTNKILNNEILEKQKENFCTTEILYLESIEWNLIEILNCLYRLAVNDAVKYDMYEIYSMKTYLKLIIFNGNLDEQNHALKLLWQFCFDQRIAKDVREDTRLFNFINDLSNNESNTSLQKNSSGIIWLLTKQIKSNQKEKSIKWVKKIDLRENVCEENKHLMISYNRENRDLCLRIKDELEKAGFSVWIDVENIHGSSLESMANAIENSECVLICMSERYKLSPNCRAEAEYAFQIKKPIIPLIMQQTYKPDGWLGIILGSKIFIDFTKYDFDECTKRLMKEIVAVFSQKYSFEKDLSLEESSQLGSRGSSSSSANLSALITSLNSELNTETDWTENDVDKWLMEKKFNSFIIESIRPSDGKLLYSMFKMFETAPESFYSSLNRNGHITLRELVYFSTELKNLFSF